ncbi:MAG: DUF4374 domain-containing protein, partial [Bacteroidota bacterium]|nr:DUF4374 domain-containing protein [Bacteroidota bacterium]
VYVGNGKFVGIMASERTSAYASGNQYAIIDVYNQTVTPVSGTPNPETVVLTSSKSNYVSDDKSTVSVGITTETGSWIYNIDVASATATQGKEVVGGTITAISKLDVVE